MELQLHAVDRISITEVQAGGTAHDIPLRSIEITTLRGEKLHLTLYGQSTLAAPESTRKGDQS